MNDQFCLVHPSRCGLKMYQAVGHVADDKAVGKVTGIMKLPGKGEKTYLITVKWISGGDKGTIGKHWSINLINLEKFV